MGPREYQLFFCILWCSRWTSYPLLFVNMFLLFFCQDCWKHFFLHKIQMIFSRLFWSKNPWYHSGIQSDRRSESWNSRPKSTNSRSNLEFLFRNHQIFDTFLINIDQCSIVEYATILTKATILSSNSQYDIIFSNKKYI